MAVNSFNRAFPKRRLKLFAALLFAQPVILVLAAFLPDGHGSNFKQLNIAMRAIGHHLLLRDGDSTSRVLPVVETSPGVFLMEFESAFGFEPDTLVAAAQRFLARMKVPQYTVTVQECSSPHIVYGFEITSPREVNIPCRGRRQPRACYDIEVAFAGLPEPKVSYEGAALIFCGILSGFTIVLFVGTLTLRKSATGYKSDPFVQKADGALHSIGIFAFDPVNRTLKKGEETTPLTDKECMILKLLYRNIGQLTSREELIQEVWTDEGVITGRSLDMFISKLRKKLSGDPDLRITNVHGKGYRLEKIG